MKEETNILEVEQKKQYVGPSEKIIWDINTSNVASSPTAPAAVVYDLDLGDAVTSTIFPSNSPSASGNVISLDLAQAWTVNHTYVITVTYSVSTEIKVFKIYVECVSEQ